MKGYEILDRALKDLRLDPVFGNPGSTEIPMMRGFSNYILTMHDSLAVGMADGYSLISGRPSVVNLHTLPGVANSVAFIHTARQNRSPVIITAGQQDSRHAFYEPLLWHDLGKLVGDAVKYSYEVKNADDIEKVLKRAYSISLAPPMGPVFISFPMDVMDQDAEYSNLYFSEPNRMQVDLDSVAYVAEQISMAKNPVIVAGSELDAYGVMEKAVAFAEKLGCPVFAEPLAGRSPFLSSSEVYAGDLAPATTSINVSLLPYDLVLNFGGDFTMYPYLPSKLLPGKRVITVSMHPNYKHGEYITGNPGIFMEELSRVVEKSWAYRRGENFSERGNSARNRKTIGPAYVISKAKKRFQDHIIVDEAISSSPLVRSIFGYRKNSYFTARTGQLGWGMPAAAGISLVRKNVLEIVGDGAIMYTIQTLWTVSHYRLPVKILVLNNGGYSILKSFSRSFYPEVENHPSFSFNSDLISISRSFGVPARLADPDLKGLDWLVEGDEPKLLVVDVSRKVPELFP